MVKGATAGTGDTKLGPGVSRGGQEIQEKGEAIAALGPGEGHDGEKGMQLLEKQFSRSNILTDFFVLLYFEKDEEEPSPVSLNSRPHIWDLPWRSARALTLSSAA